MQMRVVNFGIMALFLCTPFADVWAADLPAGHPPIDHAQKAIQPSHNGEVVEAVPAAEYVYLRVKGSGGDEWLAALASDLKPGTKIRWNDGLVMRDFTSKTLNRTFASVRFVEIVERAD